MEDGESGGGQRAILQHRRQGRLLADGRQLAQLPDADSDKQGAAGRGGRDGSTKQEWAPP